MKQTTKRSVAASGRALIQTSLQTRQLQQIWPKSRLAKFAVIGCFVIDMQSQTSPSQQSLTNTLVAKFAAIGHLVS